MHEGIVLNKKKSPKLRRKVKAPIPKRLEQSKEMIN